jgi:hypothetical protein
VHLRSWSPSETAIVGYGRPPGLAGASGAAGGGGLLGGLLSLALPADILALFSTAEKLAQGLLWWINPENWARVIAGITGAFLGLFGIGFLIAAGA